MPVLDVWSTSIYVQDLANLQIGKQHCYQLRKKIQNPDNQSGCGAAQKLDAPVRN
jgi:hypothetical protein